MIERLLPTPLMHRIVALDSVLFLGGVTASDKSADIDGQTRQVLATIEERLLAVGSDRTKILSATIYLVDIEDKERLNVVWKEWFKAVDLPARTAVGVNSLGPEALVEIAVIASR
jgi:enamine deaminase RidA (YjgF/YER057c/UK114 family)